MTLRQQTAPWSKSRRPAGSRVGRRSASRRRIGAFRSVRASRVCSEDIGGYRPVEPSARVHVWVFALHTTTEPARYDPLDVDQWEFRVLPHRRLLASGQVSAGLSFFTRYNVAPVSYSGLPQAVRRARAQTTSSPVARSCFARSRGSGVERSRRLLLCVNRAVSRQVIEAGPTSLAVFVTAHLRAISLRYPLFFEI
jgi:hypothetical protein